MNGNEGLTYPEITYEKPRYVVMPGEPDFDVRAMRAEDAHSREAAVRVATILVETQAKPHYVYEVKLVAVVKPEKARAMVELRL